MPSNKRHNEHCRDCKKRVEELLSELFGKVSKNYSLGISSDPSAFKNSRYFEDVNQIFIKLQDFRGFRKFVKTKRLPNVDFFVHERSFILEFDESQHFTEPRKEALSFYPGDIGLGFSKEKWIGLCKKLTKRDNDPPYRDEQRAWYDTMRDLAAPLLGLKPTVRVYSRSLVWCLLNPKSNEDVEKFRRVINDGDFKYE